MAPNKVAPLPQPHVGPTLRGMFEGARKTLRTEVFKGRGYIATAEVIDLLIALEGQIASELRARAASAGQAGRRDRSTCGALFRTAEVR